MPAKEKGRETSSFYQEIQLIFHFIKKQPLKTKCFIQNLSPNWSILPGGKPQSHSLSEVLPSSGRAPLNRYCCPCTPLQPAYLDHNGKEEHERTRRTAPSEVPLLKYFRFGQRLLMFVQKVSALNICMGIFFPP